MDFEEDEDSEKLNPSNETHATNDDNVKSEDSS